MAASSKYSYKIKEEALSMMMTRENVSEVSRALGIPPSTLYMWREEHNKANPDDTVANRRKKRQEEFVDKAWGIIADAQEIIAQRLKATRKDEENINILLEQLASDEEITADERKAIVEKLKAMRVDDIGKLTTTMGIMYDKQALANNEPTQNIKANINVVKFEDIEE
jgi:transposase-like protein